MKLRDVWASGLAIGLLAIATPIEAAPIIDGSLSFSGQIIYDTLDTTGHAGLDFTDPHVTTLVPPPTSNTGTVFELTGVTSGSYMDTLGIQPGTKALILNITNCDPSSGTDPCSPSTSVTNYTYAPNGVTGAPFPVVNFLDNFDFTSNGSVDTQLHFDITEFPNLIGPSCGGPITSCVEGPFQLSQITDSKGNVGVQIEFKVIGQFKNEDDGAVGDYTGTFDITLNNVSLETVGNRLLAGLDVACGGFVNSCPVQATFDPISPVPEPATMLTFGLGSLVLARMRRRKK